MKKVFQISLLLLLGILKFNDLNAQFSGGSGTVADPYQIGNFVDLQFLSENNQFWGNHFVQTADIDAIATLTLNNGAGFSPIGTFNSNPFTGSYNGNGFVIENFYINRPNQDFIGLFGYVDKNGNGNFQKIGVTSGIITGKNFVGAIAGRFIGFNFQVDQCFSNVEVIGQQICGGISGEMHVPVSNSYALGDVSGGSAVGGLVGFSLVVSITNCYAVGAVINNSGNSSGSNLGGLIGQFE